MFREEVVKMMTDFINNMNREAMLSIGGVLEHIDRGIEEMQPELNRVNGELYDMLKENGIIRWLRSLYLRESTKTLPGLQSSM